MSVFVKAAADALVKVPAVNAVIDGNDIIYRDYTDISIAVATPKGLVVPVLRNVDSLSFADVEKACPIFFLHHCVVSSNTLCTPMFLFRVACH